ncbi:MAG: FHA domain-containing protein [Armatimonadetes bacterium]|nr:FHA domain-containing protein [Armatimonadota bacterium]
MISRALSLLVAGALGAFLAWAIVEPFAPSSQGGAWQVFEWALSAALGFLVGGGIGLVSGYFQGSRTHTVRGFLNGALIGLCVGPIGVSLGGAIFAPFAAMSTMSGGMWIRVIGRAMAFSVFGGLLGLAEGAIGKSSKRAVQGMVGGILGGFLGGLVFEWIAIFASQPLSGGTAGKEIGAIPRAVSLTTVGAGIGLMIGLVEALARSAWVRLIVGRNEGKEWPVDANETFIGRDERAHIPLFGDPNVAAYHAKIVKDRGQYVLVDAGSPLGVGHNGSRVGQALLVSGDMIQIGSHQLQFMLKSGQMKRLPQVERFQPQPIQPAQVQGQQPAGVPAGVPMAMPMQVQQPVPLNPTVAMPAQQATPAAPSLAVVAGPLSGQKFTVTQNIEIGRESPIIPLGFDSGVSRRHASVAPAAGGVQVTDLGSTNGTLVNGARIQQIIARIGDTIQIGSTTFRVEQ